MVMGEQEQPHCLDVVLRDPGTTLVHHAEVVLRVSVSLVGGELKQSGRLDRVLRDPGTIRVHQPEVALPAGVPLVGGEPVQPDRLAVVLRDSGAICVHRPEVALRRRRVPAGRSRDKAQEPLDVDFGRDGERRAADRADRDPANVAVYTVAAAHPAALEALCALAVVVLVLEADRARVHWVVGNILTAGGARHRRGTRRRRPRRRSCCRPPRAPVCSGPCGCRRSNASAASGTRGCSTTPHRTG